MDVIDMNHILQVIKINDYEIIIYYATGVTLRSTKIIDGVKWFTSKSAAIQYALKQDYIKFMNIINSRNEMGNR